jgi:exopolyphosphatase/pppGpp-phosphohydrolase
VDAYQAEDERLDPILRLAESCDYEEEHAHQVTRLALLLFDELEPLHRLGYEERFLLQCAALLHDIGWIEGQQAHHKTSLRIILDSSLLPFDERERLIVGSTARYHRKALPKEAHTHFAALEPKDQDIVRVLAACLRVADGLDRTHWSVVDDLWCEILPDLIIVHWSVSDNAEQERIEALDKGQLLEQVFGRRLAITWQR